MVSKKKKEALARLRSGKLLKKAKQLTLVLEVNRKIPSEPKPFIKKIVEEDRRNFFFR